MLRDDMLVSECMFMGYVQHRVCSFYVSNGKLFYNALSNSQDCSKQFSRLDIRLWENEKQIIQILYSMRVNEG